MAKRKYSTGNGMAWRANQPPMAESEQKTVAVAWRQKTSVAAVAFSLSITPN